MKNCAKSRSSTKALAQKGHIRPANWTKSRSAMV